MTSGFVQRQIERSLSEAEAALAKSDWATLGAIAARILALDPNNVDGQALAAAAARGGGASPGRGVETPGSEPRQDAGTRSPGRTGPATPSHPTSFANGRYAVKRFLGEGGKKRVYLAHDTVLDRDVAFALIKTEGLDETAKTRITREAQAMGRLGDHPHLMPIHDLGREGDQPYMTLPLMGGGDVEGLIKKAPSHQLPIEKTLEIGIATAKGLAFAHGKGIIHRDIKPGNVWLTAEGIAKIGDFGLAVASDTATRLTTAGMMVGTVSYMPPEQAMGGEVTAKADLYSLGAMLYEMVTGRPPFVGDDAVAIIGQHLNTPPVAPSWHRPDCPPPLEGLILRLLEKDPAKRPASANDVLKALEGMGKGGAVSQPAPGLAAESPKAPQPGASSPSAPGGSPTYRSVFVGREAEIRQLQGAFDAAMSGQGALAMVVGEPGIGKTAVCQQLSTYVALRGGKALFGHSYEEGSLSLPYLAFVEAMRSYVLAREPEALKQDLGTGAADVARIVSEVRDRVSVDMRPAGDPEDDRYRLLQAVGGFLRNASSVHPLLLVLEDLHWADKGTLDSLLHLARDISGDRGGARSRLLIVGTYRDVEVDRSHPLSATLGELRRIGAFIRVPLRGLTPDEVHRMVLAISGQEAPYSLAEAVHRQTEGNPLFIQEVLRYLVEEGRLGRGGSSVKGQGPLDFGIPEGLRDVIGRRLSRLSAEANRILAIAAVIGRDFRLDTLVSVSALAEDTVVAALEEAERVGVVQEQTRPGGVQYRFAHAFFRQTLYEELSGPRRLRLHQQVARALETQFSARLDEHAAELAEHFGLSTDPADLAKAIAYAERAAQRALSVFAYSEAARHLEHALEVQEVLDSGDKARRCDLLLALGEALMPAGESRGTYEQVAPAALALAEALKDDGRAARVCALAVRAGLRLAGSNVGGAPGEDRWAVLADRYARPDTLERIWANYALARQAGGGAGDVVKAATLWDENVALAVRLGKADAVVTASIAPFASPPSHEARWLANARLLAAFPLDGAPAAQTAVALWQTGRTFYRCGEPEQGLELWARARRLTESTRDPEATILGQALELWRLAIEGKFTEALGQCDALLRLGESLGAPGLARGPAAGTSVVAGVATGRFSDALATFVTPTENRGFGAAIRALAYAHIGRRTDAVAALNEAMSGRSVGKGDRGLTTNILCLMLDAAVTLGDPRTAVIEEGLRPARWVGAPVAVVLNPARLLGDAAALLDRPAEAHANYRTALEVCAKMGFRPEIALARLHLAELLLDLAEGKAKTRTDAASPATNDDPAFLAMVKESEEALRRPAAELRKEGMAHLDFAIGEFRDMKMQPSVERALKRKEILKA